MSRSVLLKLAAVSGLLTILAAPWALAMPPLAWVCKPLTTALLIAWAAGRGLSDPMRRPLLLGLVCSWVGDVALLWPQQGFLPGLVSFLLAHVAYGVALWRGGARPWWPAIALYAVVALAVLQRLWPGIAPALQGPVVAYVLALAAMAALAAARWRRLRSVGAAWGALGGALFMLSDATLAFDRFAAPVPLASLWILASYWAAQACIAAALPPPRSAS
ncbi:lysoplasmalogenase [Ideonella sp. 4Y11]|uniref:Lysoplasmalogenase n=1 Tax=Ideonella aquatica TaxID=2824119 RepID=A0A940YVY5_9BURK|nr:lysoplasmalogenase [Ideonella aquatica]MBQ0960250.1 lysoplasmalogenase [Ideonella aquatica]